MGIGLALVLAGSVLPLTQGQADASTGGSLSVSHTSQVAGRQLTFQGRGSTSGQQRVTLQRFLNGAWHDRKTVTTDSQGNFSLADEMLGMPQEFYRVKGRGFVTPKVTVDGINQEVDIYSSNSNPILSQEFTLSAAVTPAEAGRGVKFFKATSIGSWQLLGQATTGDGGVASIRATGQGRYKAVAMRSNGASAYPSLVLTLPAPFLQSQSVNDPENPVVLSPQPSSAYLSAEKLYSWWPAGEIYEWQGGEGTRHFRTYQGGSGHASTFVGMLTLLSGSYNDPIHSYGTTATTLANQGHETGRWEMRTKQRQYGTSSYTPFTVQLRLVRAASDYRPRPNSYITIAEWRGFSGQTEHAVTRGGVTYGYTSYGTARNNINYHNYAVELTRRHLTWLIDGEVIATAPAGMLPTGKWVPQFVLEGKSGVRMTSTRLGSDWLRYFPLSSKNAKRLPTGPRPTLRN